MQDEFAVGHVLLFVGDDEFDGVISHKVLVAPQRG